MRNLDKAACPAVLAENHDGWSEAYQADPTNATAKYRYRHPDVKAAIRAEAHNKCVYCESKVGHNTPGDVEHKVPSSKDQTLHFDWGNLTLACNECNRRKGDYYDDETPFLDPFVDDVEAMLVHHGPLVGWRPDEVRAEVSVRTLQLNDLSRDLLIGRKVERIEDLNELVGRLRSGPPQALAVALERRLEAMRAPDAEYSGMVSSICESVGF